MRLLYLFGMLLITSVLTATPMSERFTLRGQIVAENDNRPLEYATISAYTLDSTLVDGTITDATGAFTLNLKPNEYRVRIDFIGFTSRDISVSLSQNVDLQQIKLTADKLTLNEVEVTGQKSQVNLQLDKKVFNVDKNLLAQGGSANEVLDNVPSVTVEANGAVSLRGNSGVKVLINGRPSSLADNNALNSIPASSIEKVEVITNPSARYEAAGTAGIINIVLKAERKQGFNGTVTVTAGIPADYQPSFSFNFRREKINFFGNIGGKYANYKGRRDSERINYLENAPAFFTTDSKQDRNDKAGYGFTGLEYFISPEQTLTASYSNYSVVNTDQTITDFFYKNIEQELTQQQQQILDYREPESYNQLDLTYTKTYADEEDKKWTTTFQHDFWFNDETEIIALSQSFPSVEQIINLRTNTIESSKDYLLQTDYQTNIGEKGMLEMGLRAETRVIKSDFFAESQEDNEWQIYKGFDNRLDYYERIGSGYLQYGQKFEKFSYLLGLRSEYTFVKIDLEDFPQETDKDYLRFFPTVNLSYQFQEATGIQLSYSKRIRRPSFWQLNPFRGLSDPNEIFRGNPDMDPAYTDRVEFNFLQTWDKLSLNPAIYYSVTHDYFGFFITQEEDGLVVTQPVNLDLEQRYGIEVTASYRPVKALSLNGEINWFGYQQQGQFADREFDFSANTLRSRLSLQYRLPIGVSLQGRINYRSPYRDVQSEEKAITYADFGIAKKFYKDKLTVTFNLRNAFDSRWYRSKTIRPTFIHDESSAWNVRRFGLNLTYRFQQGERLPERRARGSIR